MQPRSILALILLAALCITPACAAVKYIDSSPVLFALVTGTNEFYPGHDATIAVIIRNSGLNTFKFADSGTIARDDLPTTAKLVSVQLLPLNGVVTIRTDPQSLGDIPGGGTARFNVSARIASDVPAGEYMVPLLVRYRYLDSSVQEASDTMQFVYATVNETLPLTIKIRPQVRITVLSATSESLNIGTEAYLHLSVRNDGSDNGKKATVQLGRSGSSPVMPTDRNVFIGDFPSGGIVNCTYKVAVSGNAEEQTYPIDVSITYENNEGTVVTSDTVTIGIPVGGKARFFVTSPPAEITAGQTAVIEIVYENTGIMPVYAAQSRISAVPPFTSDDDTAYLGDIRPGRTATARYGLFARESAEAREYTLDSEVRYRDALDNSQIADTIKVTVRVLEKPGTVFPASLVTPCLIAAGIIGVGYYLLVMRKKQ